MRAETVNQERIQAETKFYLLIKIKKRGDFDNTYTISSLALSISISKKIMIQLIKIM